MSGAQKLPSRSTFLNVGQVFTGTQNMLDARGQIVDTWKVNVRLRNRDIQHGQLFGYMEVLNVPSAETVETFWEGRIIGNKNYSFLTGQEKDVEHWVKFSEFLQIKEAVQRNGCRALHFANYPVMFMRWKEKYIVNASGKNLVNGLAGFYYVCLSQTHGFVNGFYYDLHPEDSCIPFQTLNLSATNEGRRAYSFAADDFQ